MAVTFGVQTARANETLAEVEAAVTSGRLLDALSLTMDTPPQATLDRHTARLLAYRLWAGDSSETDDIARGELIERRAAIINALPAGDPARRYVELLDAWFRYHYVLENDPDALEKAEQPYLNLVDDASAPRVVRVYAATYLARLTARDRDGATMWRWLKVADDMNADGTPALELLIRSTAALAAAKNPYLELPREQLLDDAYRYAVDAGLQWHPEWQTLNIIKLQFAVDARDRSTVELAYRNLRDYWETHRGSHLFTGVRLQIVHDLMDFNDIDMAVAETRSLLSDIPLAERAARIARISRGFFRENRMDERLYLERILRGPDAPIPIDDPASDWLFFALAEQYGITGRITDRDSILETLSSLASRPFDLSALGFDVQRPDVTIEELEDAHMRAGWWSAPIAQLHLARLLLQTSDAMHGQTSSPALDAVNKFADAMTQIGQLDSALQLYRDRVVLLLDDNNRNTQDAYSFLSSWSGYLRRNARSREADYAKRLSEAELARVRSLNVFDMLDLPFSEQNSDGWEDMVSILEDYAAASLADRGIPLVRRAQSLALRAIKSGKADAILFEATRSTLLSLLHIGDKKGATDMAIRFLLYAGPEFENGGKDTETWLYRVLNAGQIVQVPALEALLQAVDDVIEARNYESVPMDARCEALTVLHSDLAGRMCAVEPDSRTVESPRLGVETERSSQIAAFDRLWDEVFGSNYGASALARRRAELKASGSPQPETAWHDALAVVVNLRADDGDFEAAARTLHTAIAVPEYRQQASLTEIAYEAGVATSDTEKFQDIERRFPAPAWFTASRIVRTFADRLDATPPPPTFDAAKPLADLIGATPQILQTISLVLDDGGAPLSLKAEALRLGIMAARILDDDAKREEFVAVARALHETSTATPSQPVFDVILMRDDVRKREHGAEATAGAALEDDQGRAYQLQQLTDALIMAFATGDLDGIERSALALVGPNDRATEPNPATLLGAAKFIARQCRTSFSTMYFAARIREQCAIKVIGLVRKGLLDFAAQRKAGRRHLGTRLGEYPPDDPLGTVAMLHKDLGNLGGPLRVSELNRLAVTLVLNEEPNAATLGYLAMAETGQTRDNIRRLANELAEAESVAERAVAVAAIRRPDDSVPLRSVRYRLQLGSLSPEIHNSEFSFDALAAVLSKGEAVLHLSSRAVAVIDRDGVDIRALDIDPRRAATALAELVSSLDPAATGRSRTLPEVEVAAAYDLWTMFLAPVEDALAKGGTIRVVASGLAVRIPFDALVTEVPPHRVWNSESDSWTPAWAARRWSFAVMPSLRAIVATSRDNGSVAEKEFLGLGAPALPENAGRAPRSIEDTLDGDGQIRPERLAALGPLPAAEDELESTASALGVDDPTMLLGDDFTWTALQAIDWSDYRIISVATHGLAALRQADIRQLLVLSPGDPAIVTDREVRTLALDANLIILSACDSGPVSGAATSSAFDGFARNLIVAGARNVIVSRWPVVSGSAALFTVPAAVASSSRNVNEALHAARLAALNSDDALRRHPAIWAAFAHVGAW